MGELLTCLCFIPFYYFSKTRWKPSGGGKKKAESQVQTALLPTPLPPIQVFQIEDSLLLNMLRACHSIENLIPVLDRWPTAHIVFHRRRSRQLDTKQSPTRTPGAAMAVTHLGTKRRLFIRLGLHNFKVFTFLLQVLNLWRHCARRVRPGHGVRVPGDGQLPVPWHGWRHLHRQLCRWWERLQANVRISNNMETSL